MASRLSLTIERGYVALPPDGRIAVFGPRADADLSTLPKDRVTVLTSFKPDHDHFSQAGYHVDTVDQGPFSSSIVCLPRSKDYAKLMIAQAAQRTDGHIIVDGQKTDGIDSLIKECRKRTDVGAAFAKAHGKVFSLVKSDAILDWLALDAPLDVEGFQTQVGIFSADRIDKGSRCLVEALPKLGGAVADFGAGWGYLSAQMLKQDTVGTLHMIEADKRALNCARHNITDPRAAFHWSDVTTFLADDPFDTIISNPPFHTTRAADPGLGQAFLGAAARNLKPRGTLWIVANRHLPYEATLKDIFHDAEEVAGNTAFKVLRAHKPRRGR
ncbi:class I SAM-dependent methyltransferase [Pseudaestuariivita rosea]|uniref:class I SAM-dependent methyltransferase n=1 Tax=Pseudaestuariivita rosea TaxID=2763263 RepID=UPI001ABAD426|nr:methyltransferase [Pseudaestuariivita rosea]